MANAKEKPAEAQEENSVPALPTCAHEWIEASRADRAEQIRILTQKQHHGQITGFDGFHRQTLDLHHQTQLLEAILLTLGAIKDLLELNSAPQQGAKGGKK